MNMCGHIFPNIPTCDIDAGTNIITAIIFGDGISKYIKGKDTADIKTFLTGNKFAYYMDGDIAILTMVATDADKDTIKLTL